MTGYGNEKKTTLIWDHGNNIDVTMELWNGSKLVDFWSDEGLPH